MTEEIKGEIERAVNFMKSNLEEEITFSHGFIGGKDGLKVFAFDDSMMATGNQKTLVASVLLLELLKGSGTWSIFISDACCAREVSNEERAKLPDSLEKWPKEKRSECLFACVNQIGERGFMVAVPYSRSEGKIVWEPIDWQLKERGKQSGRFLYDLTPEKIVLAAGMMAKLAPHLEKVIEKFRLDINKPIESVKWRN